MPQMLSGWSARSNRKFRCQLMRMPIVELAGSAGNLADSYPNRQRRQRRQRLLWNLLKRTFKASLLGC